MKHFIPGVGKEMSMRTIISVPHKDIGTPIRFDHGIQRSFPSSVLLDYTSSRPSILFGLFPGVRESRSQQIYGAVFADISGIVAETPDPQGITYAPYTEIEIYTNVSTPRGCRLLIGMTIPKESETPVDVFVRGILPKAVVIIARNQETGKFDVSASDRFGDRVPPSAKQIRTRLAFLNSY